MSEKTLKSTFNLRWFPCQKKDSDAAIVVPGKYPEDGDNYFMLQQFFADGEGGGEWLEIAVDWSYRNDPPKTELILDEQPEKRRIDLRELSDHDHNLTLLDTEDFEILNAEANRQPDEITKELRGENERLKNEIHELKKRMREIEAKTFSEIFQNGVKKISENQPKLPDVPALLNAKQWYENDDIQSDVIRLYKKQRELIQWAQRINEFLKATQK